MHVRIGKEEECFDSIEFVAECWMVGRLKGEKICANLWFDFLVDRRDGHQYCRTE